jgi:hypothetical protein
MDDSKSGLKGKLPFEGPSIPTRAAPSRDEDARPELPQLGEDYYLENGFMVFTAAYHLKRGFCCGSGCRHCPYEKP